MDFDTSRVFFAFVMEILIIQNYTWRRPEMFHMINVNLLNKNTTTT